MGDGRVALILDISAIVRHAGAEGQGSNAGALAPGELVAA